MVSRSSRSLHLVWFTVFTFAVTAWLTPGPAAASPWTVPDDELTVLTNLDFSFADEEFLPDGTRQAFPLEGQFASTQLTTTLRYGFSDAFEGGLVIRPKAVFYRADPVILPKNSMETDPSSRVLDFNSQRFGVADIDIFARYQFLEGPVVFTSESVLQLPTGYDTPAGTFRDDEFAGGTGTIQDDTTLGDGVAHLHQSFLLGAFISPTSSFLRADVGYKLRFGAGDQVTGGLKLGQLIGDKVVLFAGLSGAYTIYEGPDIGTSFVAADPSIPAEDFQVADIRMIDISLDKNYLNVRAGVIVQTGDAEFQLAYGRTVLGENIPVLNSVSIGTSFSFSNITGNAEGSQTGQQG
mgnify:CR=1 FL=1